MSALRAADAMGFRGWLYQQRDRRDPVGDLARDVLADNCLGRAYTVRGVLRHMIAAHQAEELSIAALRRAAREYDRP